MLKTLQILMYMSREGYTITEVWEEITEIVDNERSTLFDLSQRDISSIQTILLDDKKFNSALRLAGF